MSEEQTNSDRMGAKIQASITLKPPLTNWDIQGLALQFAQTTSNGSGAIDCSTTCTSAMAQQPKIWAYWQRLDMSSCPSGRSGGGGLISDHLKGKQFTTPLHFLLLTIIMNISRHTGSLFQMMISRNSYSNEITSLRPVCGQLCHSPQWTHRGLHGDGCHCCPR